MTSPPAYNVDDEIEVGFQLEDREYRLRYAGAPLQILHQGLGAMDAILDSQYFEVDMAFTKDVKGVLTQGGFYEERFQNLYPFVESWVPEYALSYSNDGESFQYYRDEWGGIVVCN